MRLQKAKNYKKIFASVQDYIASLKDKREICEPYDSLIHRVAKQQISGLEGESTLYKGVCGASMQYLIDVGYDINTKSQCSTPLYDAANWGNYEAVEVLIAYPEMIDLDSGAPLYRAVQNGSWKVVCKILKHPEVDIDQQFGLEYTLLHLATSFSYPIITQILLDHGADPNIKNASRKSPLHLAVEATAGGGTGRRVCITEITSVIENLMRCERTNQNAVIDYVDKSAKNYYVLHHTILTAKAHEIMHMLNALLNPLYSRININATDIDGKTALHHLVNKMFFTQSHQDILDFLLRINSIKVDIVDNLGRTALHYAIIRGNVDATKSLLESGALITIKCNDGKTVLAYAIEVNQYDIIKILLPKYEEELGFDAKFILRTQLNFLQPGLRRTNIDAKVEKILQECDCEISQSATDVITQEFPMAEQWAGFSR